MVALGSGAQKSVQDRIQALGPTLLSLYPGQSFMRGVASDVRVSLTMDDDTALANNARYVTDVVPRSEEHTSELQSRLHLVCRLLLEKKKKTKYPRATCARPRSSHRTLSD